MESDRKLIFRQASLDDTDLLFAWANDPETRRNSFSAEQIPYENHVSWFQKKLSSPDTQIYIASITLQNHLADIGMLRLDREENRLLISYAVAPAFRGRGLGLLLLHEGLILEEINRTLSGDLEKPVFYAEVKPDNTASVKIFEKLGFKPVKSDDTALHFTKPLYTD